MASTVQSIISNTGVNVGKGVYRLFARDRNVIIPLDNPSKTQVLSDIELKNKFCKGQSKPQSKPKPKKDNDDLKKVLRALEKKSKPKKRKSNLERLLERM
ncbi:MAG: hypothetical protein ACW98D_14025 [Promethearchaeota archaeon]|jgi:hypothetical protein